MTISLQTLKIIGLMIIILLSIALAASAKTIYVAPTGSDESSGLSWQEAKSSPAAALAIAESGDEIWVAAGTYNGCITLKSGVALYGGFVGKEDNLSQRNYSANITILDGQQQGSVVTGASNARTDGFTIQNGKASGGGGVACSNVASFVITNNIITANQASGPNTGISYSGGGIYSNRSSAIITNNRIIGNAAGGGGGIQCFADSSTISNNIISGNSALYRGGGIYFRDNSSALITNNTIVGNTVSSPSEGGGITSLCSSVSPTIANNIIAFNSIGIYSAGLSPLLRSNCVYNFRDYVGLTAGTSDIQHDPLFVDKLVGNLHLSSSSPCINAGNDSDSDTTWLDIDDEARLNGAHVDIGADEWYSDTVIINPTPMPTASPTPTPIVIYVATTGNDNNSGLSWPEAKKTVTAGLAIAVSRVNQVWVAAGVYYERITLKGGVLLYGGFAGTEDNFSQRDFKLNATILDGQQKGTVVTATSANFARIDGFIIRNGREWSSYMAGGIYCSQTSPVITNNTIIGNSNSVESSGAGGIYCIGLMCTPLIINNSIIGNRGADEYYGGGGICCSDKSSPTIANNVISANAGGGIDCQLSASPFIINNTIVNNTVRYYRYSGNKVGGGGIYCWSSSAIIINNIIAFNEAGISNYGGAPAIRNNCVYNDGDNYTGISAGAGDINLNPKLAAIDFGNFHLLADSPCIDATGADDTQYGWTDMDNLARISGDFIDIGADEFDGTIPAITPAIIHVSQSGSDANDGSTWQLSKRTVQAAIDAASNLEGAEVWVAEGVYNECINLRIYVYLYGGFAGNETQISQRDWNLRETILDGHQSGSVVTATQYDHGLCRIDGFTIRNGSGTIWTQHETRGGGIYCVSASPVIENNKIIDNNATICGGIYYSCPSGLIINNKISGNTGYSPYTQPEHVTRIDIAVYAYGASIINNTIDANSGCGIDSNSSLLIYNNTITGNGKSGIYSYGLSPRIANNIIAFNQTGIYNPSGSGLPLLYNNCVYNPNGDNYTKLSPGTADISVDPLFADRVNADFHLLPDSPCVDQGNDTYVQPDLLDMDQESRINGQHVDMGADEYYPFISGTALLGEYDPVDPSVPVAVKLQVRDLSDNIVKTQNQILNQNGNFNIYGLNPGDYKIYIKACSWLHEVLTVTKEAGSCDLGAVPLGGGDLHGDNECLLTSLSIVLANFGSAGEDLPAKSPTPPTPAPSPGAPLPNITGTVVLCDYDPLDQDVPVAVKVELTQNGWPLQTRNVILTDGRITIPKVAPGSYDIAIKAATWLQKVIHVEMPAADYDLGQIELINGDPHGDNECFFTSLSIILKQMGQQGDE